MTTTIDKLVKQTSLVSNHVHLFYQIEQKLFLRISLVLLVPFFSRLISNFCQYRHEKHKDEKLCL